MPADGSGPAERLTSSPRVQQANDISRDGKTLALQEKSDRGDWDILIVPIEGEHKPRAFATSPFDEAGAVFSPDGRFVAYHSGESGRNEVYVQSFPGPGGKRQVSLDCGIWPLWSRDGKELFFKQRNTLMAAPVSLTPTLAVGRPIALCDPPPINAGDVAPDGRFVVIRPSEAETDSREIRLILNWTEELKRRLHH